MITLKEAQEIINENLIKQNYRVEPIALYEPIEYVLSIGGKRIRPALTLLACDLFSNDYMKALMPAIGLEVFHNFTLLHDDIMDKADLRRNQTTVHKKWNENVAILSGDAMCIKAYEYICHCDADKLKEIMQVFNKTALQVCEGQQYDMNFEDSHNVTVEEYLQMIELKTSVLLAASLKVGAIIGNASKKDADYLYNYGRYLGLAFQLQDDLLDVFGNTKTFGKKIGGDIVSNKKTFLLINAINLAKGELKEKLNYYLNNKEVSSEEKIEGVRNIFIQLGVKELSESKIDEYFSKAEIYLDKVEVENHKKEELKNFLKMLHNRIH